MVSERMVVTIEVDVRIPPLPNFLRQREEQDLATVDVADLPDDALRRLDAVWTDALVEHARQRREARARAEPLEHMRWLRSPAP